MQSEDLKMSVVAAAAVGLIAAVVFAVYHSEQKWQDFKVAHDCKPVAYIKGDVVNTVGVGSNGQITNGVATTPDKTGWLCNDGVTYFR